MHYSRDDVVGTILFTEFTIALLPSIVTVRNQLKTVKLRYGEGPIVLPEPNDLNAAALERGKKGPKSRPWQRTKYV